MTFKGLSKVPLLQELCPRDLDRYVMNPFEICPILRDRLASACHVLHFEPLHQIIQQVLSFLDLFHLVRAIPVMISF